MITRGYFINVSVIGDGRANQETSRVHTTPFRTVSGRWFTIIIAVLFSHHTAPASRQGNTFISDDWVIKRTPCLEQIPRSRSMEHIKRATNGWQPKSEGNRKFVSASPGPICSKNSVYCLYHNSLIYGMGIIELDNIWNVGLIPPDKLAFVAALQRHSHCF